ncbi:phosphatidate cytidylyltransferase [Candidatus Laterigemmans baculatus]|uniref:phosphatidate cytidylyltransferase n=1 Tax=Candidatus Laterigemmans baculatus TaxID=2770505 RepID=UPI001F2154E1|nr:phosphatidate cytidylyltransferase [Candidatus Laterigemmans baculatus]
MSGASWTLWAQAVDAASGDDGAVWLTLRTYILLAVVFGVLGIATLVGIILERRERLAIEPAMLRRFNHRLRVWWMMFAILVFGFLLHRVGVVVLFGLISFWALREFITMTPTRRGDHRTLFWVFFVFTPLQYILIGLGENAPEWLTRGREIDFYGFYSIMIPVYASLFIPARIAIAGDFKRFLERSAKIQAGLLVCVYSLSYAPALLDLDLRLSDGGEWTGSNVSVLFFLILIAQIADVLQQAWSRVAGKNVIAIEINASRTWEGVVGSMITTGLCGAALSWATPFAWWEAGMMSMVVAVMAFAGGMTLSAIKRDRGVNDTGTLVQGHAGLLDRIDNVCFAAPVFYHLTRFYFSAA